MLRKSHKHKLPTIKTLRVLGIDDWATINILKLSHETEPAPYALAIKEVHPNTHQVADRFHLL